jgi:uncharacterized coiled-coil protein SlyX
MKMIGRFCFLVLASGMALAQANPPSSTTVADDLKAMREAIAAQQQQIAQQQKQIESLTKALDAKTTPHVENAALTNNAPVNNTPTIQSDSDKPKESPLSFRIGGAEFTPGGFLDFENVFRSTNTGNVSATNFWAIPFSNTTAGHLTEYRSTGQYSRINLKVTEKFKGNDITGYAEADFNGNDAANVFVTSNSHTFRLRVYWVDLKHGKWEVLAGSTWGLQTPNRTGISPSPSDLAITIGEDAQTHVGLNYTRAAAIRFGYHASDKFAIAVEAQNPQQFVGQGAEVAFPAQFNTAIANVQLDAAATAGVPNLAPDIIAKMTYDTTMSGRHFHVEAGGLTTTAKIAVTPSVAGAAITTHSLLGGGLFGAANADLTKKVRLLASGMYGPGVGRYLIGMGPQVVVAPVAATAGGTCLTGATGGCDVHLSPVHSGDLLLGVETQPGPKTQIAAYYGGAYFQRNAFADLTAAGAVKPIIGFGGNVVNNAANRAIQEGTVDFVQTFWKSPQYGSLLTILQGSYITRSPWFVAAGAPKNAHLVQGFVSLRYVLP